jgi:hypothetical protein
MYALQVVTSHLSISLSVSSRKKHPNRQKQHSQAREGVPRHKISSADIKFSMMKFTELQPNPFAYEYKINLASKNTAKQNRKVSPFPSTTNPTA